MLNKITGLILLLFIAGNVNADSTGVRKVSDMERNSSPNVSDVTYCIDVSDDTRDETGTGKRCLVSDLFKAGDITINGTNTGIGSLNPEQKLVVNGTVKATAFIGDGSGLTGVGSGASVSDAVYGAGWNGDTTVAPSKNAVYDKIETLSGGGGSGTVNSGNGGYITYYPTTGTTVDDQIVVYTDGTNLGVGSTTPSSLLDVNGSLAVRGNGNIAFSNGVILNSGTTSLLGITGGNVGINSLNPSYNLDITGNLRATSSLTSVGLTNTGSYTQTGSSANTFSGTSTFTGSAAFSNAKSITTSGNVGVGSATPGTALDVTGTTRTTAFQLSTNPSSGYVLTSNSVGIGTWMPSASGSGSGTVSSGTSDRVAIYDTAGTTVTSSSVITDNNTNVGIGSVNPGTKLDVTGTARATAFVGDGSGLTGISGGTGGWTTDSSTKTTTTYNVGIGSVNPTQTLDVTGTVKATAFSGNGTGQALIGSNLGIGLDGVNLAATSPKFVVSTNGNVGVNSTVPTQQLEVVGTAKATAFVGDGSLLTGLPSQGWTDNGTIVYNTTSTDNIAIGTTASFGGSTKLTVKGGSGTGTSDFIGLFTQNGVTAEATGTASVAHRGVWVMGDGGSYYGARDVTNDIELLFGISSLGTGFIGSTTNHPMQLRTNATSRLAIDTSGNVGISTTIPTSLLEVTSTAAQNLFRVNDNGPGDTSPFLITSVGNVGIGSVTPGAMLDVSDDIRSLKGGSSGVGACWCTTPPKVLGYCTGALGTCSACNYNGSGC